MPITLRPTLLQATRLLVEVYGEEEAAKALAEVHHLSEEQINTLMRQLKASQN